MANKILALILSLVIPGLGQLYGGQGIIKSVIFFIIAVILYTLGAATLSLLWFLSVIFNLYAAYDAYTKCAD